MFLFYKYFWTTLISFFSCFQIIGFITEAILVFTKARLIFTGISQVKFHWICMLLGGLFGLVGFASVYFNKENNGKPHFVTYHGYIGVISCIALGIQICFGPISLYHYLLKKFLPLKLIRRGHAAFGIIGYGMAVLAIVLATYSNWFNKKASAIFLWYPVLVFIGIFIFVANHLRCKYIKHK